MKDVNLTLMQTFYMVAKEGSYSAAARRLKISYQSAANHVRRLEQSLGYRLVHSEQGMKTNELTARGKKLYQLLSPEFDAMLTRLSSIIDEGTPLVRVGMPQATFYYLFQDIIKQYGEIYDNSQIFCFERDIGLADLVHAGQLDAFITERNVAEREVKQYLIGSYRLSLIYPRAWGTPEPGQLTEWADGRPFITYEAGHIIRNIALRFMQTDHFRPRLHVSTSGSSSVKRCVTSGLGFAVIPAWTVGQLPPDTASLTLDDWPHLPVYFGEAAYLEQNPYIKTLRELCLDQLPRAFEA